MTDRATLVERDVDVIARTFYEWGIGRGNDFGWDEAPTSIRDRCYHAADAAMRGIALLESSIIPKDGLREQAIIEAKKLCLQVRSDLSTAHAEICKLQGLDPSTYSWPDWTPQANTLRWIADKLIPLFDAALSSTAPIVDGDAVEKVAKALWGRLYNNPPLEWPGLAHPDAACIVADAKAAIAALSPIVDGDEG